MSTILTNNNLKNVHLHSSGLDALRIQAVTSDYFITKNGDICIFLEMKEFNFAEIMGCISNLEEDHTLQIYKLWSNGHYTYYICITCRVKYQYFETKWLEVFDVLTGPIKKMNHFLRESRQKIDYLENNTSDNLVKADVIQSDVLKYLWNNNERPRSNCSIIRSASNYYLNTLSINNIGSLPLAHEIFNSIDSYLQVVTIIRPSKNRENGLKEQAVDKALIISMLRDDDERDNEYVHVHTVDCSDNNLITSLQGTVFYVNAKYVFAANSVKSLNSLFNTTQKILSDNGIVAYNHTITGGREYIATFPGNGYLGEHYHVIMQNAFGPLLNRIISL
jgi:hypothetical protein